MTRTPRALRLGTRGSRLALAQAEIAADALRRADVASEVELVPIQTRGDRISATTPRGGWEDADGQFTSELEAALLDGRIDAAVHSHKDLPTAGPSALVVAAVLERGDPSDCLLVRGGGGLSRLPPRAVVGTSSARRAAQLQALRPDISTAPIRGNVETRIARMEGGEYDAIVLAAAGLDRLGIEIDEAAFLPLDAVLPAPAQGALAIQVRADDAELRDALASADHAATRIAVETERALLRAVGGGCLAPLGALAEVEGDAREADRLRLRGNYLRGDVLVWTDLSGRVPERPILVERAAADLVGAVGATA